MAYVSWRQIATEVCRRCHERNSSDVLLLTLKCRSKLEHNQHDKVLVTEYYDTLVKIRPMPAEFRPPRFFRKCYDGPTCTFYPRCTYAHSEAEKNVWNTLLRDERYPLRERQRPQQHSSFDSGIRVDASTSYRRQEPADTAKLLKYSKLQPSSTPTKTNSNQPSHCTVHHPPQTFPVWNTYMERQKHPPPEEDMMLPVTLENYRQKYRALLYYEEEEHVEVLKAKCDGQYKVVTISKRDIPSHRRPIEEYSSYACIKGMSASQIAYALQASSHAVITISYKPPVTCKVDFLSCNYNTVNDSLYIGFDEENEGTFPSELNDLKFSVKFEVKHSYFNDLNITVSQVADNVDALKRIIPNQEDFNEGLNLRRIPKTPYSQLNLDNNQFRGLQTMLFSRLSAPVLIPGPFGCGKTRLLAVATRCIIHECKDKHIACRVLICCYQQNSADIFMKDYFFKMIKDEQNPWDVEVVHVTSSRYQAKRDWQVINAIDFRVSFQKYRSKQYLVIVTTCGGALRMSGAVPKDYFTHILIDEGAQTREPETIAPLIMANKDTRIIIAGDSQQVGPKLVVLGDEPQQYGLGVSLLERLHNQYERFGGSALNYVVSLTCNYRCHPDLLELPSTLFYKSALVPQVVTECHPACSYPLKFICSSFNNDIPFNPENPYEASLILQEVKDLLKYEGWDNEDVCIMAASLNQANCIRKGIYKTRDYECLRGISVRTSYQMQGQEYSLLLISTSESLESSGRPFDLLKSFCHPTVFNTAITRARSLVVAVGNPLVLMMSEATMDEPKWCWREFITRCLLNNAFVVPDRLEIKYSKLMSQLQKIRRSRQRNEIMALFRSQSITMETKVMNLESELVLKPLKLISSMQPPSKTGLGPKEAYNPWPEFDLQAKRKESVLSQYSSKDGVVSQGLGMVHKTKEALQFSDTRNNGPLLKKKLPVSSPPSSPETHKKLSTICTAQNKSTYNPDRVTSMLVKTHDQDFKKQKKTRKRSKKNDVFTHKMSEATPPHKEHFKEADNDNTKLQNATSLQESISSAYIPKRQLSHNYKRSKQETTKKTIVNSRSAMTFQEVIPSLPSFKRGSKKEILKRLSIYHLQGTAFKHEHRHLDKDLLEAHLNRDNYKAKFHQLLCREEEEHHKILEERCDGHYNVTVFHPGLKPYQIDHHHEEAFVRFGLITGGNLNGDTISYIKQACADTENVVLHFSNVTVKADIVNGNSPKRREVDVLLIAFTEEELSKLIEQHFRVKKYEVELEDVYVSFTLKWSYFDRLHDALDKLSTEVLERIVLVDKKEFTDLLVFENSPTLKHPIRCVSELIRLDSTQLSALTTIMNCEHHKAPVLIIGSFGTGKTRLLARAAYQILQHDHNSRVLICAHHQSSADAFIENYFGKMYANGWYTKALRIIPNWKYRFKDAFEMHYTTVKLAKLKLKKTHLVVTTFSTSLHLFGYVHKGFFTHILLDEGAQSREPESIAPLCLADKNTKIVIAGDHKQVGPSLLVLGDMVREHGLNLSLLERLHQRYRDVTEFSMKHTASLLTNYRCHHALLSLPSYLFYDSALITAAKSATSLHPKVRFPLHFICSSLVDDIQEITDSKNELEASLLLKEALKYITVWPTLEWEEKDLRKVCIMAATANQKYHFYKELRKREYSQLEGIQVLTAYDIQGREFEAIFLSTAEPTTAEGKSKNPTKTPCSQYVFNTALTRAKSLVVCAGNPFLLMKIEEHMKNECSCWKDYIRQCVVSRTFSVPSNILKNTESSQDSLQHLQKKIFPLDNVITYKTKQGVSEDSILESYKQAGEKIPQYIHCKQQIQDVQESMWNFIDTDVEAVKGKDYDQNDKTETTEIVTCELSIKNQYSATAKYTGKGSIRKITINGYNYRKGAFNGDIVRVQIIGKQTNEEGVVHEYGRVVKVIEARHPTKYICRADQYSVINFYPLDKCAPGIVNLPRISQNLLQYNHQIVSASQKDFITVFKEESLPLIHQSGDNKLPQIKELVPYSMSQNLLFVVQVLGWAPKMYRKPLGAVVEALPCTTNLFFTERLLKISHSIEDNIEHDPILTTPEGDYYDRAFTIDPPGSKDLDDAISLVPIQEHNTYKLAVLITNVAKYIPKEHELDKIAQRRGTSVYGGDTVVHMLPHNIITQSFSLNYNTTRDALAVTATVVIKERNVIEVICNGCPEIAQVTSQAQLTYKSAQNLMDGKPIEFEEMKKQITDYDAKQDGMSMVDTLKLLYQIAMKLRVDRLSDAAYSYDVSEPGEEDCWQTHFIIEELMIWTNAAIAEYLKESLPKMALVRYQLPPQQEDVKKIQKIYENVTGHSFALKRYSISNDNLSPLYITTSTLEQLHSAYNKGDYNKVRWLLFADKLYPQLAIVHNELRSINNIATYSLIDDSENQSHYSLCLEAYTHFTSPIRRYFDLLVQRLVIALLNKHDITYSQDELKQICNHLNLKSKMAKEFERTYNNVQLTRSCEATSQRAQAFLSRSTIKPNKFELCFPSKEFKSIRGQDICFSYSDLNYCSMDDQYITWHITSTSLCHGSSIVLNSNIGDFSQVNDTHLLDRPQCYVQAMIYHHFDDNKQHLKCSKFLAPILNDIVSIEADKWKLIQESLKSLSDEQLLTVQKLIPECLSQKTTLKKSHYSLFSESPIVIYDVTRRFSPGEIVDVWLGKSLKQSLPSPGLQLIEIAPTVRVCIQHNQSPALCFSDIQLHKASQEQYHSISEYVELWSKVLVAEAANECVKTKELTLLHDATLQWPKLLPVNNCVDDVYYIPNDNIILEIPENKLESLEFIEIKSGDFVCARYEIPTQEKTLHAVYHFVVTRRFSKKKDSKKSECICMLAEGDESCRISECIAKHLSNRCKPLTCDIQIISMPDSFHRVYARLKDGPHIVKNSSEKASKWSELSQNVAQGVKSFPTVTSDEKMTALQIMKTDPLACQIWDTGVQLNDLQKEAVERSLKNKFQLIQGPPGTGKSVTGAHLAYVFSRQNKALHFKRKALYASCVLYCGPSNKAVDVVHDKLQLLNTKFRDCTQKIKVLRLYGRTHERQDFPDPCHNLRKVKEGNIEGRCLERFHNDALHYKIRKTSPEIVKIETEFKELLEKGLIPSSVQRKEYKDIIKIAELKETMMDYDIILCTCNETCSQRLLTLAGDGRIAQCIVDECGMANEPETIAAVSLCDHVILIGDHKQLQPIIKYSPAKECGLGISLFERYASMIERNDKNQFKDHLITLQIQYRMHPFICKGPSQCFYDGLLEADQTVVHRSPLTPKLMSFWHKQNCPIIFYDVIGKEEKNIICDEPHLRNLDSHSMSNKKEADFVLKCIKRLQRCHAVKYEDIAILTPYKAQKELLKKMIKEDDELMSWVNPRIATIVESQGDEYNIVILTTVRSLPISEIKCRKFVQPDRKWMRENLGFLTDEHQVNVGITRAKYGLIIVGNSTLLKYDETWAELIELYSQENCLEMVEES